jgi:hypothetical protein
LTIGLRVKSGRFSGVDFEDRREGGPEMRSEDGTAVGDDGIGETVKADDVGDEEISEFRGCRGFVASDEVGHLGHAIDEYEDRVLVV